MNNKPDVIMAVMKLSRAMRRHPMRPAPPPPPHEHEHGHERGHKPCGGHRHEPPMAGGRLLSILKENSNLSSRELAELLDIRPSSLTELLTRLEQEQLVVRTPDENDRRVVRVSLTEKGSEREAQIAAERAAHLEKFSACFTEEEAAQFCALCDKLAAHLETSSGGKDSPEGFPEDFPPPPPHHHCHGRGHGCGHGHGHMHRHDCPPEEEDI